MGPWATEQPSAAPTRQPAVQPCQRSLVDKESIHSVSPGKVCLLPPHVIIPKVIHPQSGWLSDGLSVDVALRSCPDEVPFCKVFPQTHPFILWDWMESAQQRNIDRGRRLKDYRRARKGPDQMREWSSLWEVICQDNNSAAVGQQRLAAIGGGSWIFFLSMPLPVDRRMLYNSCDRGHPSVKQRQKDERRQPV